MKRKTLDLIKVCALSVVMALSLAACGGGSGSGTTAESSAPAKEETPAAEAETPAAEAEAPAAETETPAVEAEAPATEAEAAAESATEEPAAAATAAAADIVSGASYDNGGVRLLVPDEYADGRLMIDVPQDDADGFLFKVTEKASYDAAVALGESDPDGAGWLFSIGKVSEEKMLAMICEDMSGSDAIAKDADGNYYIFYHPTDVRLVRENNDAMNAAMEEWSALNHWANTVRDSFAQTNTEQVTPVRFGNSSPQIYLARVAYMPDANYTVSTLEYAQNGPLLPAGVDAAPYVSELITDAVFDYVDEEAPDGEYIVLAFPDENTRLDFFYAEEGQNYVREVISYDGGETENLYKVSFTEGARTANEIMDEFVKALAEANNVSN